MWFLYQLIEAHYGLFSASANGGGVAFFAHIGRFLFEVFVARAVLASRDCAQPFREPELRMTNRAPARVQRSLDARGGDARITQTRSRHRTANVRSRASGAARCTTT
jgi:hypothetical protein